MASPFSSALQDGCKDSAMRYTTTPLQTPHDPHTSTSTAIQVSENSNERTSANNSHQTEHASRSLQRVSASLTSDAGPATGTDSVGATSTGPFPGSGDGYFFDSLAADAFAGTTQPSVVSSSALYAIASYETTPPRLRPALTPSSSLQPNINIVNNAREHWNVERGSRATHGASPDGTAPATTTIAPLRLQLGTAHAAGNGVGVKAAEAARPRASTGPSSSSATSRAAVPLTTSSAHRPELQGGRLPQSHSTVDVPYSQMLSASLTPSRPLSALDSVTHSRGPYFFGTPQTEPDVNEQSGHSGVAGEEAHAPLPATTAARSTAGQQRQSSAGFTHRRHTPMCPDDSSASSSSRLLLLPPPSTLLARGQQLNALNSGSHSSSAVNAMASESGGYCLFGLGTPSVDRPSRAARVQGCKDSVESGSALLSLPAVDSHRTSDGVPDAAHPLTPVPSDNTHVPSSGACATDARDGREALATPLASPVYFGLETVPSTSGLEKGVRASPVLLPSATPAGKLSRQGTTAAVNKEKESDGKEKVAGGAEKAADVSTTSGGQQAAGGHRPLSVAKQKKTHDDDIGTSATISPQQVVQQPPMTATALLGVRAAASPHARQPSHRPSLPSLPAQAPRRVSSSSGSLLLSPSNGNTETSPQGAAAARAAASGLEAARRATVAPLTAFTPPSVASAAPPAAAGMPPLVVAPADRHRYDTPHTISTESSHPAPQQQPHQQLEEAYVSYLSISSGSPATGAVVVAPAKAEGKGEATHSTNGRVATSKRVSLSGPTLASPQTHASQQPQQQEEQQQHQIQSPAAGPPGHHASSRQHLRATRVPPPLFDAAVTRKSCSMSLPSTRSERSGANPALEGSSTGSGSPANATSMQRRSTKRPGDSMNSTSLSSGVGRGVSPPGRRFVLRRAGEKKGLPSRINLAKAAKAAQTAARSRGDGRPPSDAEPPPSSAQAPSASAGSSPAASNLLSASQVSELMSPPPLSGAQTERQRTKDDPQQKPETGHSPASAVRVAAPSSAAVPPLRLRDEPNFISSATSPRRGVARVGATRLRLKAKPLVQSQQSALTASTASSVTSAVSVRPPAAVGAAAVGRPSPSVSISSSQPPVLLHAHTGRSLTPNSVRGSTATAVTAPTSAAALCGVQPQLATPRPCDAESPPVTAAPTVGTSASTTTVTVRRGGADTTLVSPPAAAQPPRGGRLRFQPRVSRQVRPTAKEAVHRPPLAHRPKQPGLTPSARATAPDAQKQEKSRQQDAAVLHDSVVSSALVGAATPSPRGPAEQSVLGSQEAVSGHSASHGSSQSCASVRPSRPQREQSAGPTEIVRGMPPRSTPAPAAAAGDVEKEKVNKAVHVDEDAVEPTGDTTQKDQTAPSLVARHAQGSVTAPSVGEEEEGAPSMPTTPYLITAIRPPRTRAAAGPSKRMNDEAAKAAAKDASEQVEAVERREADTSGRPPHRVLVEAVEDSRKQAATPVQMLMEHDSQPSLALNREETEAFLCAAVPSINEEMERQINSTRTQAATNAAVVEGSAAAASCVPAGPTDTALRGDSRPLHNVSNLVEAVPLVAHSQLGKGEAEGRNKSSRADVFPTSASPKHQHTAPIMEALASPTTSSEAVSPSAALSPEPSTAPPEAASRPENVSEIGALPSFVNVSDEATQSSAITGPSAITTDQSPSQATDGTAHSATVTCLTNTKIMRDTTQAPTTVTRTWVAYTAAGGASTPTATACYPRSALYSFFASVCGATQPPGEGEAAAQLQLSGDDGTATCPSKANTTASFHATPVLGSRATTGASLVTIASTARGVGETPRHTFSSKPPSPAPLLCDPSSSALVTASVSTRGGSYGGGSGGGSSGAHTNSGVGSSSPMTRLATLLFTHSHAHAGERASMVDDGSASVRGLSHTGRATTVAAAQLPPAVLVTPPLQDKEEAVTERRMSSTTASVGPKKKDDAEVVSGAAMEGEAEQQALDATLLSPSASPTSAAQQLQQHLAAWQRLSSPFTEPSLANTAPLKKAPPSLVSPHAAAAAAAAESERAASLQTCRSLSGRRWTSVLSADRLHEFARIASLPRASRTTDRGLPTHVQVHPGSSFFCSADMPLGRRATRPSDGKLGAEKPLRGEMRFCSVITNNSTPHLINATPAAAAPRDPQPLPVLPNNAMEQLRQEMCAALLNHPGDQGRKAAAAMGPQQVSLLQQVQVQSSTSTSGVYPDADSSSGGRWSPQSSDRGEDAAFPRRASRQPGRPTVADTAAPRDRATVRRTSRRSLMWPSQHQPQQQSSPRASTGAHEDDGTVRANAAAGPGKAPGDGTSAYARPPFSDIMALLHSDDEDGGASGRAERSGQSDVAFIAYDADVEDVMRVKAEVMRRTGRRPSQTSLTQRRPLSAHFTPDSVSSTAGTLSAAKPCLQTTSSFARSVPARSAALVVRHTRHNSDVTLVDPEESLLTMDTPLQPPSTQLSAATRKPAGGEDSRHEREGRSGVGDAVSPTVQATSPASPGAPVSVGSSCYSRHDHEAAAAAANASRRARRHSPTLSLQSAVMLSTDGGSDSDTSDAVSDSREFAADDTSALSQRSARSRGSVSATTSGGGGLAQQASGNSSSRGLRRHTGGQRRSGVCFRAAPSSEGPTEAQARNGPAEQQGEASSTHHRTAKRLQEMRAAALQQQQATQPWRPRMEPHPDHQQQHPQHSRVQTLPSILLSATEDTFPSVSMPSEEAVAAAAAAPGRAEEKAKKTADNESGTSDYSLGDESGSSGSRLIRSTLARQHRRPSVGAPEEGGVSPVLSALLQLRNRPAPLVVDTLRMPAHAAAAAAARAGTAAPHHSSSIPIAAAAAAAHTPTTTTDTTTATTGNSPYAEVHTAVPTPSSTRGTTASPRRRKDSGEAQRREEPPAARHLASPPALRVKAAGSDPLTPEDATPVAKPGPPKQDAAGTVDGAELDRVTSRRGQSPPPAPPPAQQEPHTQQQRSTQHPKKEVEVNVSSAYHPLTLGKLSALGTTPLLNPSAVSRSAITFRSGYGSALVSTADNAFAPAPPLLTGADGDEQQLTVVVERAASLMNPPPLELPPGVMTRVSPTEHTPTTSLADNRAVASRQSSSSNSNHREADDADDGASTGEATTRSSSSSPPPVVVTGIRADRNPAEQSLVALVETDKAAPLCLQPLREGSSPGPKATTSVFASATASSGTGAANNRALLLAAASLTVNSPGNGAWDAEQHRIPLQSVVTIVSPTAAGTRPDEARLKRTKADRPTAPTASPSGVISMDNVSSAMISEASTLLPGSLTLFSVSSSALPAPEREGERAPAGAATAASTQAPSSVSSAKAGDTRVRAYSSSGGSGRSSVTGSDHTAVAREDVEETAAVGKTAATLAAVHGSPSAGQGILVSTTRNWHEVSANTTPTHAPLVTPRLGSSYRLSAPALPDECDASASLGARSPFLLDDLTAPASPPSPSSASPPTALLSGEINGRRRANRRRSASLSILPDTQPSGAAGCGSGGATVERGPDAPPRSLLPQPPSTAQPSPRPQPLSLAGGAPHPHQRLVGTATVVTPPPALAASSPGPPLLCGLVPSLTSPDSLRPQPPPSLLTQRYRVSFCDEVAGVGSNSSSAMPLMRDGGMPGPQVVGLLSPRTALLMSKNLPQGSALGTGEPMVPHRPAAAGTLNVPCVDDNSGGSSSGTAAGTGLPRRSRDVGNGQVSLLADRDGEAGSLGRHRDGGAEEEEENGKAAEAGIKTVTPKRPMWTRPPVTRPEQRETPQVTDYTVATPSTLRHVQPRGSAMEPQLSPAAAILRAHGLQSVGSASTAALDGPQRPLRK